mgnify:CR=1 FL=1|tara:strand:+ start:142 stop:294 length:153 start_codon:yes stop_codon:yes gene_type:complete
MRQENNTQKELERLFKTAKITFEEFSFRSMGHKLNVMTFKDDKTNTIKYL